MEKRKSGSRYLLVFDPVYCLSKKMLGMVLGRRNLEYSDSLVQSIATWEEVFWGVQCL